WRAGRDRRPLCGLLGTRVFGRQSVQSVATPATSDGGWGHCWAHCYYRVIDPDSPSAKRSTYPTEQPQVGYRRRATPVASACAWAVDCAHVGPAYGRGHVRDPDYVRERDRHLQWRRLGVDGGRAGYLQTAYPAGLFHLSDFTIYTHDSYLERRW